MSYQFDRVNDRTLTYHSDTDRFVFVCDWDGKEIAKEAGLRWDKEAKQWWTSDIFIALKLAAYAEPDTRKLLDAEWSKVNQSFHISQMSEGMNIDFPRPQNLEYKPFQKIGIYFALTRTNTLIADEMGLGKTIQALGVINALSAPRISETDRNWGEIRKVLIVTPASLKINWLKETRKWLVSKLTYGVADAKFYPRHTDIVIINYDILGKWSDLLCATDWDLLIADEAHYVKNQEAQRSENFYKIPARRRIYMTGTPLPNRPKELFPLIHSLSVEQFPKFFPFGIRYCGGAPFNGSSNEEELQAKLRSTIMVRRFKKDVMKDLPPKTRQIIELPTPPNAVGLVARELAQFNDKEPTLNALKQAIKDAREANDTFAYRQAVDQFKSVQGGILASIAAIRKDVAMTKVPLVIEHLRSIIEEERKVVVFAHHHDVMNRILDAFSNKAVKFSGKETLNERDKAVTRFQNDPSCMIFIGSITAAGVGITLTASSHVVFAELDWVPGNLTQCEDRTHRIGQENAVLIQHLVLESSLDYRMAEILVHKQEMIDAVLNNQTPHFQQHSFGGSSIATVPTQGTLL